MDNNKIAQLYKTDFVLVDNNYQPVEDLDTCYHETSIEWLLDYPQDIEDKLNTLKKEGEISFGTSRKLVSMTRLPKEVQDTYIKFYLENASNYIHMLD